jgi:hypothetical protein
VRMKPRNLLRLAESARTITRRIRKAECELDVGTFRIWIAVSAYADMMATIRIPSWLVLWEALAYPPAAPAPWFKAANP